MKIREAQRDDIPDLMPLAIEMHKESRYSTMDFCVDKTINFLLYCIENPDTNLVAIAENADGDIVGAFAGFAMEHWFSPDKYACDYALFVPPGLRGSSAALHLVSYYVGWAKAKGVPDEFIQLGITTGVEVERTAQFFNALGFKQMGELFIFAGGD